MEPKSPNAATCTTVRFLRTVEADPKSNRVTAVKRPVLNGTLGALFPLKGRGTVLVIENFAGEMPSMAQLRVGNYSSKIIGVDFPRRVGPKEDGSFDLDTSIIALLVEEDAIEPLLKMMGQPVKAYEL